MVNPNKHRKIKEQIQDLDINVIEIFNSNPEGVIKELSVNNAELKRLYNKMVAKEGSVLGSSEADKLLKYIFRTDYSLETIKLNYNAIKLESEVIDNVINLCYEALDVFQQIKELQQANLSKLGLDYIINFEIANSNNAKPVEYYSSDEFLNLINLNYIRRS